MKQTSKRVVVIGGGTGTHTVLKGLKQYQKQLAISAIVTMADSGGSTGRLRDEFGYLPVGDVRMALSALASETDDQQELLRQLFMYRFEKGQGLSGHSFGNLLLVALRDILGSEAAAIKAAARVLRVRGQVLPVTTESVNLVATYSDGSVVTGEHSIDEPSRQAAGQPLRIKNLSLTPAATIDPAAEAAILDADMVVLGPGDLYTSVLANCVVAGVPEALQHTQAALVYIPNLMTKYGQTDAMGVAEHISEIRHYVGRRPDAILINTTSLPADLVARYALQLEYPVVFNYEDNHTRILPGDFLANESIVTASGDVLKRSLIRHDSRKLAAALVSLLA